MSPDGRFTKAPAALAGAALITRLDLIIVLGMCVFLFLVLVMID